MNPDLLSISKPQRIPFYVSLQLACLESTSMSKAESSD